MIRKLAVAIAVPLLLGLACEGVLRATGRPHGTFAGTELREGLWRPYETRELRFGPFAYTVVANSQGFRGPELRGAGDPPALRVAAVGDSMTDGFFVDNDATYPSFLQATLQQRGVDAEVVNAARGGGSIDRFTRLLERHVLPLEPDVVIVSFVTNDLHELGGAGDAAPDGFAGRMAAALVTRTALGEAAMQAQLWLRGADADRADPWSGIELSGRSRYRIPGGTRHAENARSFLERYRRVDAELLVDPLPPEVQARLDDQYLPQLARFRDLCAQRGIALLFVYFPAYPQLYLAGAPTAIQDQLAAAAQELRIPFLDLSDALRDGGVDAPVHLAPVDFHLNPRGNQVVARAVADALKRHGLLPNPSD